MLKNAFRPPHAGAGKRARLVAWAALLALVGLVYFFRQLLYTSWTLAALRVRWRQGADDFILSKAHDDFDITFVDYDKEQLSAAPHQDLVPPVLHHIALGRHGRDWRGEWRDTVQSCLDMHPGWESHLWTDETASRFVECGNILDASSAELLSHLADECADGNELVAARAQPLDQDG